LPIRCLSVSVTSLHRIKRAANQTHHPLDQYTSGTYNTYATSEAFKLHSMLSTIGVIKAIFQSISQPPMAKIADVFGRVNAYVLSVFLYVLGYIIQASAPNIYVGLGLTGLREGLRAADIGRYDAGLRCG
jgi:MFS family permease